MEQQIEKQVLTSNGVAWAAVLAAAIGCGIFGLMVDLAEAFGRVSQWLGIYKPSGDLSGKSTVAIAGWLVVWLLLHFRWKSQGPAHRGIIMLIAVALIVLSLIATFPPFFGIFAP
ncbi:MAG TPA: hypothetical protein VG722_11095 [Tepidisphaeraceae bacterium]|nr:hypothetical protein [Tepidisphaeraceae bacterium]